jgi:hypothetical protein
MSTLSVNIIEPISGNNVTISGSLTLTPSQSISGDTIVSNVLVFSPISTPVTTEGKIFYSSSGVFYFGNV